MYHTHTESEKGGSLLYIADHLNVKPKQDLDLIFYKPNELESIFVEIVNPNKKKISYVGVFIDILLWT